MPLPTIPPTGTVPLPGTDRLGGMLLAIQARIGLALGWGSERVPLVDPDKLTFHPHGDSYVCVWPDSELPDGAVYRGAGRLDFRLTRKIYVNVRSRTALDDMPSSAIWLTDESLGNDPLALQVWNALVEFPPLDGNGNALSLTALAPTGGSKPKLDLDEKEWGESALAFEVVYQPAIAVPPY